MSTRASASNLAGASGSNFSNVDQLNSSSWITKVRDNGGALNSAYDPLQADAAQTTTGVGTCPLTPCTYDFNKDNELWVQAQSTVRGKPRNAQRRGPPGRDAVEAQEDLLLAMAQLSNRHCSAWRVLPTFRRGTRERLEELAVRSVAVAEKALLRHKPSRS